MGIIRRDSLVGLSLPIIKSSHTTRLNTRTLRIKGIRLFASHPLLPYTFAQSSKSEAEVREYTITRTPL